ncbi:DNA methylase [Collinsella sp. AK_207A]|uniref:site-specific DNA-methyltransferase n=1 Tax=Collinsella sp. AK_207A TaxID=2650472 RepID=UPI001260D127|nr:site-specific DNA-methyltransferase [Collinsella sp. AK_207A]VWL92354.1 DNA methylase [Collinsella sp. AK_207A]
MDKIERQTADLTAENVERLGELFPNVMTEVREPDGTLRHVVDFDALREQLGDVAEGPRERYQFTWPGKREARAEARRPCTKTLRPQPEKSKDWDTTENLYIEGDNLEALKLLRNTYAGKVKMIYIDPPYNTGHDFIYDDDFAQSREDYDAQSGDYDEEGGRLVANPESNGRFHSDWCSMMYPRLLLARDLLTEDGVIFISIDDSEQLNLRELCNEVFNERNFIAQLIWERAYAPKNDAKYVSNSHDYVLMYAKNADEFKIGRLPRTAEANARYKNPDNDPRGPWKPSDMSVKTYNASCDYQITTPSGRIVEPPTARCWRLSRNAFLERLHDNRIWFGPNGDSVPCIKRFLSELKFDGMAPQSILFYKEVGHSQEGAKEVVSLFDGKGYFDGPKPTRMLKRLITLANLEPDSLVLDFFSGSASTADALIQMNAEKQTVAKFILVQLPEETPEDREASKDGYRTICEIGEERIRRAGEKIREEVEASNAQLKLGEEPKKVPDIGFRVLKIDSSNFEDVYATPEDTSQQALFDLADNLKDDRAPEDLLFEALPAFQIPFSAKIERIDVAGFTAFDVDGGALIACFDTGITNDAITAMAKREPSYCVVRDASFADAASAANFEQIFKTVSPATACKVI